MTLLEASRKYPEAVVALLATGALAWWLTAERMVGMDAGPGTDLGTLGWFTGSWALMMAAMMLPSLGPTLAAYATVTRGREPSRWLLFICAYLAVWAAAGTVAYGIYELGKALLAPDLAWRDGGRWVSGAMIAAAAVYEFVPLKQACLARCRGQLGIRSGDAQQGPRAALTVGARSGVWCIGCTWALMGALFALGVMSLTWMALVAALVAVEKAGPSPRAARVTTAVILALLALGVLIAPHLVPSLVVPGSGGMHAMKAMG